MPRAIKIRGPRKDLNYTQNTKENSDAFQGRRKNNILKLYKIRRAIKNENCSKQKALTKS